MILTIVVFVTVVLVVFAFGAAAVTPTSVLGARLRALGGQPTMAQEKPALKVRERIEQALDPLSKAIPLSPSDVSRTRAWLIQAGLRESRHVSYYFGARLVLAFWVLSASSFFPASIASPCWSACPPSVSLFPAFFSSA